jgi:hypothetical protein
VLWLVKVQQLFVGAYNTKGLGGIGSVVTYGSADGAKLVAGFCNNSSSHEKIAFMK